MTHILVTYGSRFGSTREIAEYMADTVRVHGLEVDLYEASKVPDSIDKYDVVLIGSGIQIGQWKKSALNFLKKHQKALREKKTGLFVSCVFSMYPDKKDDAHKKYLVDVAEKYDLSPAGLGLFGSCLDFSGKRGLKYTITINMMKKDLAEWGVETVGEHDFRDWQNIKEWTEEMIG